VEEPETEALRAVLAEIPQQIASAIVEVEVLRAVGRAAPELVSTAAQVVAQISVVEPGAEVRARAATLGPPALRSLDAIHLATALEARSELQAVVTYDSRLAAAATAEGLEVLAPS
jgi:predicted nucleic acid-binding protein